MRSLWLDVPNPVSFPQLEGSLDVEVAVVGGGIAGTTCAANLKAGGRTVALIDAHRVAEGETGHTTAHLTAILDIGCRGLVSKFGRSAAQRVAEVAMEEISNLEGDALRRGIDCDFQRMPAFLYTESREELRTLEKEAEAAAQLGLRVTLTDATPLPLPVAGAVRYEDQARFHPRKYLLALARSIPGDGSHVFEDSKVLSIRDGAPCEVTTQRGRVTARDVVVATDSPVSNRFFLITKVAPYRTYVVAVPIAAPLWGLFWDTEDPYHYLRSHPSPDGELLIVGGEDHKVGEKRDTQACFEALERFTAEHFDVGPVRYRWSGQVLEPSDGLPYIGRNSLSRHLYVATGFSGTGMAYGALAGRLLAEALLGRARTGLPFEATRVRPLAAARRYVEENSAFPKHLVEDRFQPPEAHGLRQVAVGEGRLTEVEGRRLAVYRDSAGTLHALSPVCTHMGCFVHWNSAEKSWDCPCHGSRFNFDGEVLHGPAVKALRQVVLEDSPGEVAPEPPPSGELDPDHGP